MRKGIAVYVVAFAVGLAAAVWAHDDKMKMPSNSAAFNQMKQLVGNWKGMGPSMHQGEKPQPISTSFKLTAAGSAIEETLGPGTPHEMVDMYTDDEGGKLTMVHYCAMGNQPHMKLTRNDPKTIELETTNITGLNASTDHHMHGLTLTMPEPNKLVETWTSYSHGKPNETAVFEFTRAQ
jgi:hypothetical protein